MRQTQQNQWMGSHRQADSSKIRAAIQATKYACLKSVMQRQHAGKYKTSQHVLRRTPQTHMVLHRHHQACLLEIGTATQATNDLLYKSTCRGSTRVRPTTSHICCTRTSINDINHMCQVEMACQSKLKTNTSKCNSKLKVEKQVIRFDYKAEIQQTKRQNDRGS